jgi:hypothetical protein
MTRKTAMNEKRAVELDAALLYGKAFWCLPLSGIRIFLLLLFEMQKTNHDKIKIPLTELGQMANMRDDKAAFGLDTLKQHGFLEVDRDGSYCLSYRWRDIPPSEHRRILDGRRLSQTRTEYVR